MSNQRDPQPDEYQPSPVYILRPNNSQLNFLTHKELYAKGNTELIDTALPSSIAVIGSRQASIAGLTLAMNIAELASDNGVTIASGYAPGIDQAVMNRLIQLGAPTVGFFAAINDIYQPHKSITRIFNARNLARDHLIIAPFLKVTNEKEDYKTRNRLLTANTQCVIAIDVETNSGTQSAIRSALKQGKPVIIIAQEDQTINEGINQLVNELGSYHKPFFRCVENEHDALTVASMIMEF